MTSPGSENWFDRPMRWAQLVLVENDPGQFDLCFWLDYFRRTHSDGVCLGAGGYVAYYPTRIPLHHRSVWLGDTDHFGELVAGCHEMGMVVPARTDPHAVRRDVCEVHPDWIAVDAEGRKRQHWATPGAWVTCALGPYNFEFMTEVHKEVVAMYQAEIRKVNPHACYVPNSGGGALSDLDMRGLGEMVPLLFADRQGRRGLMAPWANGKNGKGFRAAFGRKPIGGIFSVGMEEEYRWKDSVQSEAELRIWVAEGIAHGMRPWFVKFSGVLHDRRWLKVVEDIFTWHHRVERYMRNQVPLARVGMV